MKCQYQPGKKINQTATTKYKSWVKPGGGRREMHSSMSFDQLLLPWRPLLPISLAVKCLLQGQPE